jgi:hypothetical protein
MMFFSFEIRFLKGNLKFSIMRQIICVSDGNIHQGKPGGEEINPVMSYFL